MTLRYGLRNVLGPTDDEHRVDEILDAVKRLLTQANERTYLDWTTFSVAIYPEEIGSAVRLVVEVEIAEEADE